MDKIELGTPVVVSFTNNNKKLYDFGYYSRTGENVIIYKRNKRSKNDSISVNVRNVHLATENDLNDLKWG